MTIEFGDLPIENWCYSGEITVQITNNGLNMNKIIDKKHCFFGKTWNKVSSMYYGNYQIKDIIKWNNNEITGRWKCNDSGIYYFSRHHNKIYWFGIE